jgi:PAS domain-containing protein
VVSVNLEGRINDANAAFESRSGYPKADLRRQGPLGCVNPTRIHEATLKSRQNW